MFCMENREELKLKRKIQMIVIAAMSLFFVLVVVVVFQCAIRINQGSTVNALSKENSSLAQQIQRAKEDEKYFSSPQFIYDYALRYLNRGRPGDKVFI